MKIIKNIFELNKAIKNYKNIGFVPTMGGIHKGHVSLIKSSQKKKLKTIVSVFINPTQFNKKNDFSTYPRNFKKDIKILKKNNVDYLFMPSAREIYKKKILDQKKKLEKFTGFCEVDKIQGCYQWTVIIDTSCIHLPLSR